MTNRIARKATNLSLDPVLVADARALHVNLSKAAEQGIIDAVQKAAAKKWQVDNQTGMAGYNNWIEENGLPLAKVRLF